MDNGVHLLGTIIAFIVIQFVFWPLVGRAWRAAIGVFSKPTMGRIYSMHSVSPEHSDIASEAISQDRYTVYTIGTRNRAILILKNSPALVVSITREPSFSGGAPDMIINAVYDPRPQSAEQFAKNLADLGI